jgi:hypothetical protein
VTFGAEASKHALRAWWAVRGPPLVKNIGYSFVQLSSVFFLRPSNHRFRETVSPLKNGLYNTDQAGNVQ